MYNFFVLYGNLDNIDVKELSVAYEKRPELDRWILSKYNKLVRDVTESMDRYDHMKTVRAITEFVNEDLSNWYIRRARRRFYSEGMSKDKESVFATTYEVLEGIARIIAPIAPFISDEMYKKLTGEETVHIAYFPQVNEKLIDDKVEKRMDVVRAVCNLGRGIREKESLKVRQPLAGVLVDGKFKDLVEDMTPLIMEELNVKEVVFAQELSKYMDFSLKPNFKVAGPVLGKNIKAFGSAIAKENAEEFISKLEQNGSVELDLNDEKIAVEKDFVDVKISAKEGFAVAMENNIFAILDTNLSQELIDEGISREIISKIQQMRKQNNYEMMDNINIFMSADAEVLGAVSKYEEYIKSETLALTLEESASLPEFDINGHKTGLKIERV